MTKNLELSKGVVSKHKQNESDLYAASGVVDSMLNGTVRSRLLPFGCRVVGSAYQVAIGRATHTSLQQAHDDSAPGELIFILPGSVAENVTINKNIYIQGWGHASELNGTLTITSDYCNIEKLRIMDTVVISGDGNRIMGWVPNGTTQTISGISNIVDLIEEA